MFAEANSNLLGVHICFDPKLQAFLMGAKIVPTQLTIKNNNSHQYFTTITTTLQRSQGLRTHSHLTTIFCKAKSVLKKSPEVRKQPSQVYQKKYFGKPSVHTVAHGSSVYIPPLQHKPSRKSPDLMLRTCRSTCLE